MKILIVSNCEVNDTTGSGITVLNFSNGFKQQGHSVEIVCPSDYCGQIKINRGLHYQFAFRSFLKIITKYNLKQYDLIEFYGSEFWLLAWFIKSFIKKRPFLVWHTNGFEPLALSSLLSSDKSLRNYQKVSFKLQNALAKILAQNVDGFVSLCEADRKYASSKGYFDSDKTFVCMPGINKEYINCQISLPKENRIAFIGTWIPRKGNFYLVKVMEEILQEIPNSKLDLYGTKMSREQLSVNFSENIRSRVTVYPILSTEEMKQELQKAKILFLPSQYEGFGLAYAEAMACELACVITPTGFGAELIPEKEALICDFHDWIEMKASIKRLLLNDDLCKAIAMNGRKRVLNLSWDDSCEKLTRQYEYWISN